MLRLRALGATVSVTLAIAVLGARPAGAGRAAPLTKSQADAIALQASGATSAKGDTVLFGLREPLAAGTHVAAADPNAPVGTPGRREATTLSAPTWLYWHDEDPYARFSHPSTLLLVDEASGDVTRTPLQWYPLVDGQEPPFVATRADYDSKRYRVYAREGALPPSKSAVTVGPSSPKTTIAPELLANDCVMMIGDYRTAGIAGDFPAMQKWAASVGLRAFYATRNGPSGSAPPMSDQPPDGSVLAENVATLVATDRCTDVLIYMSGHGAREGRGPPTVFTGKTVDGGDGPEPVVTHEGVDAFDVVAVIRAHPTIGFKLKVDSCYAGRFVEALAGPRSETPENLLIIEASSAAEQASYSALSAKRRTDNPDQVGEFTNQNLAGLNVWASDPDEVASTGTLGGSFLANALERAFVLGRGANRAIAARGVKPVLWVKPPIDRPVAKVADKRDDVVVCASGAPANTSANDIVQVQIRPDDTVEVTLRRSAKRSLQDQFSFATTVTISFPDGRSRKFIVQVHDGKQTIGEIDPATGAWISDARTIALSGQSIVVNPGQPLPEGTVVKAAGFDLPTATSERSCDEASAGDAARVSAESPATFFAAFGRALASGDSAFLLGRLDPRVVARYGDGQCRSYVTGLNVPRYAVQVLAVGERGPWDWTLDGRTDRIEDAIPVTIRSAEDGVTFRDAEAHVVVIDGTVRWFTDCGTPI